MASRLELHEKFVSLLGSRNVYYRPPASVKMKYDAIRYNLSGKAIKRANDKIYNSMNCYDGVVITLDPDSALPDKILNEFLMCTFGTPYIADNLNHFPFKLYY